jgi:tetratricopeptide (TPR) repeat protein
METRSRSVKGRVDDQPGRYHGRVLAVYLGMLVIVLLQGCATGPTPKTEPEVATTGEKLYLTGERWYLQGCYQEALRYYFGAYANFSAGDRLGPAARALNSIGNLYRRLGDPQAALSFYNEALEIDLQLEDTAGQAQTLINRSAAHLDRGQAQRANADLDRAEPLTQDAPRLRLALERSRGILATRGGDLATAEAHLQNALDTLSVAPALEGAATQYAMGRLRLAQERPAEARPYFTRALALDRRLGHTHGLADDLEALGDSARALEAWSLAAFHYKRSVRIFALMNHTDKTRQILEGLQALKAAHPEAVDANLTLFFVDRWVEGEPEADICP